MAKPIILAIVAAGLVGLANPLPVYARQNTAALAEMECIFVRSNRRVRPFDATSVHTTFFSTARERALRDFAPGTEQETGAEWSERLRTLPILARDQRTVRAHRPHQRSFCRMAPFGVEVARARAIAALARLGFPPDEAVLPDPLATGFRDGRERTSVWMDRYKIEIEAVAENQTLVRVTRQVFVSRVSGLYIQGISDGQNEAFILSQVDTLP